MSRLVGVLIVACGLAAGCGNDELDPRGPTDSSQAPVDYCAEFGWYGDGHCDEVCDSPDPDCEPPDGDRPPGGGDAPAPTPVPNPDPTDPDPDPTNPDPRPCSAEEPMCGPAELAVDALTCVAAGEECVSRRECGAWAHCLHVPDVCPDVIGEPASCPDGTYQVGRCGSEECVIARGWGDACNDVVFCEYEAQCLALASCGSNQVNVSTETCLERPDSCETITICGQTLHCEDIPVNCDAAVGTPPQCLPGWTEVGGCDTRQLDNGTCTLVFGSSDQCASYLYCSVLE